MQDGISSGDASVFPDLMNSLESRLKEVLASMRSLKQEEGGDNQDAVVTQTATGVLPNEMPGIDVARCLKELGVSDVFMKDMLLRFHQRYADAPVQIRALLEQGDMQAAARLTHNIKGSSGNLRAAALHEAVSRLDRALWAGEDEAVLSGLLDSFETALDEVIQSIASLPQED